MTFLETFLYTCLKNIGSLLESETVDPAMARLLAQKVIKDGMDAYANQQHKVLAPTGPGGVKHEE